MSAGLGTSFFEELYERLREALEPVRLLPEDVEIAWDLDLNATVIVRLEGRVAYKRVTRMQFVNDERLLLALVVEDLRRDLRRVVALDTL